MKDRDKSALDSIPVDLRKYPLTPDECFQKDSEENGTPILDCPLFKL